jgi:hypothetical protein
MMFWPALSLVAAAAFDVSTVADQTGFTQTGRIDELAVVCERLRAASQGCEVLGHTPEGRPLHAYVLSSVPASERATSAAYAARPTVLVIGGIHAGEIDGKDAIVQIVKRLLGGVSGPKRERGGLDGVLDSVTVVFVPVYNVDGHERFGPHHRPNQNGPQSAGWRVTSQNLNLNRDWAKADAPETRLMLGLMARYDPVVVMDLHVTDGAKFRHDIAVLVEPWHDDGTDGLLIAPAMSLSRGLLADLSSSGHHPLDFYPSFEIDDDPSSGFAVGVVPARLTHGYVARRGRIGVLIETHAWLPYRARVQATVDVVAAFLQRARTDAAAWRTAADETDRLREALPGRRVDLAFVNDPASTRTIDFLGYAYTRVPSEVSGALWTRYDDTKPVVWKIPLVAGVKPSASVTAPAAYAVLPGFTAGVSERLAAHGIAFTRLSQPLVVDADAFAVKSVTFGSAPYEGRQTATVTGSWSASTTHTLPAGSLIVPVGQARGRLVVELMEPTARESLTHWGNFNSRFERKEYMEGYVAEDVARTMLKDDATRAAFIEKLQREPAFAADPAARLDFFYRRHPSFDAVVNALPVLRLPSMPMMITSTSPRATATSSASAR